jgi:uncharacterized protein YjdB
MSMRTNRMALAAPCIMAALAMSACGDAATTETAVEPLFLRVEPAAMTLDQAQKSQLRLLNGDGALPADAKVLWESSDPTVVKVDPAGVIEALAPGEATITGSVAYRNNNGRGNAKIKVVQTGAARLAISPEVVYLAPGALTQLTFTAYDAAGAVMAGAQPRWSTSSPSVATVDALGRVTGKKTGIANIRAEYGGMTAGAVAAVGGAAPPAIGGVVVTPGSASISAGDSILAAAAVTDTAGRPVEDPLITWSSSNSRVAQVNGAGIVKGLVAGTAIITAAAGGRSANLSVAVTQPAVAAVSVSPRQDTIRAIGFTRQLTATARDAQGNVVTGAAISWTSLNPAVATVNSEGNVTAKAAGLALVMAAAAGCSGCMADTAGVHVIQEAATLELSPTTLTVGVGTTGKVTALVKDAGGVSIGSAQVTWSASPAGHISVGADGSVTGLKEGAVTLTAASNGQSTKMSVTVAAAGPQPQAPANAVSFIIGPQVPLGQSPWRFFDDNLVAKARQHRDFAVAAIRGTDPDAAANAVYYDLALVLYTLAERSGDATHKQYAHDVAEAWWQTMPARVGWEPWRDPYSISPRNSSLGGLIIFALNGGGTAPLAFEQGAADSRKLIQMTALQWVTEYTRYTYQNWLGARLTYPGLYFGLRDGAYVLLHTAWLANGHPDAAVRSEMRTKALAAARDYYARLQRADGGWYWTDGDEEWSQPFMVGLLMEALVATHQLTGDAAVATAIVRGADWLWSVYDATTAVPERPEVRWRDVPYFAYPDHRPRGERHLADGWDTNTIREGRQLNSTIVHTFGYAFKLTGNSKYRTQGDEVFSSTFGNGQGTGADPFYNLADYRAKEFNQAYRSAGRYLRLRQ